MKNGTTFVRMRSNVEKRHLASSNLTFLRNTIDKNGFRSKKADLQNVASKSFNFCLGTKL